MLHLFKSVLYFVIIHSTVLNLLEFPSSVGQKRRYFEECAGHYFSFSEIPFVNPFS